MTAGPRVAVVGSGAWGVKRCLVDLLARESKNELADYPEWLVARERG